MNKRYALYQEERFDEAFAVLNEYLDHRKRSFELINSKSFK